MILQLSENSKARVVPSSRIGRMISFGSLAAGLGVGTVAQYARNTLQSVTGKTDDTINAFLSPANAERIVDTLCKVRGILFKSFFFHPVKFFSISIFKKKYGVLINLIQYYSLYISLKYLRTHKFFAYNRCSIEVRPTSQYTR